MCQTQTANQTRTVKLGVTMDIKKEIDRIRRNCCPAGKVKYITFIIFFHWTTCLLVFLCGVYLSLFMCLFGWICCKWARRGILLAQRMIGFYWAPKLTLTSSLCTAFNATKHLHNQNWNHHLSEQRSSDLFVLIRWHIFFGEDQILDVIYLWTFF